ncbi:hypothetical protein SETIT_5G137300v2 [Setaria italica]|uniref:Uncharacterized protein n=1 Tax=Setaria italica TaxID=4555 RepID=A0A368R4R6_SETIT|nr:hypothetical protein SETIT_5G137300v2 [Setaria italica]
MRGPSMQTFFCARCCGGALSRLPRVAFRCYYAIGDLSVSEPEAASVAETNGLAVQRKRPPRNHAAVALLRPDLSPDHCNAITSMARRFATCDATRARTLTLS